MVPEITDAEFAARVSALREKCGEQGLAGLIAYGAHRDYQPADLRYLARWYCVEEETACIVVPLDGPTTLLTDMSWDVDRARAEAYADGVEHAPDMGTSIARLVREQMRTTSRVGISGFAFFPAPIYMRLRELLPDVAFEDASRLTANLRMIKSPAEIELLNRASRISDEAMSAGLAQITDGATEVEVAAAAEAVIRSAGAEPSFVTEMGSGPRTALGTFLPGARRLSAGELAVLDCGARLHGYHGDMCRTTVVGHPSETQLAWLDAVDAAVSAAIAEARPGTTVGRVRDVAADSIAAAGFAEFWWDAFMPHGNGAGQHEPPNAKQHPDQPIQEGMVLCIEPGIAVPGEGAVIIEQMVVVRADGAEALNALPTAVWNDG